jgi:hypothetical protein
VTLDQQHHKDSFLPCPRLTSAPTTTTLSAPTTSNHTLTSSSPATNFDDYDSNDEQDEETSSYLNKESEKAEAEGHDSGKPGSLLNRMIEHGNKKTEAQLAREAQLGQQGNTATGAGNYGTGNTGAIGGGQQQQTVIR